MSVPRIRLSPEEYEMIQAYRDSGHLPELFSHAKDVGIPIGDIKHYWHKSKRFSIFAKKEAPSIDEMFAPIIEELKSYSPKFEKIQRKPISDPHCLVIDPSDIHVGKLASVDETGSHYDIQKAVSQVDDAIDGLLSKSYGFNIDKIFFVIGNDVLHIDTPKRTTTSGTPQDTSGMWHEAFQAAKSMYIRAIERMVPVADVHVIFNPSNHDYMSGYMLAQTIEAYYRWSENVTFDVSIAHRKYTSYGVNLIGTNHGDGARLNDLPLIMAQEAPDLWVKCPMRYVYLHHIHHKQTHKFMSGKDFIGVTVEYLRTPSESDSWHHRNGYIGAKKAIEAFIHSRDHGQVARLTHHI
jgi:hypothetical protein